MSRASMRGMITTIMAWSQGKLLTPLTVEVSRNRKVLEVLRESCLLEELKSNQVLILDNAHCEVWYLLH